MFLRPNLSARQPGRAPYSRHAAALAMALVMFSLIFSPAVAWAVIVPAGSYTFDGNLPGNAFVSFTGTSFVTPAVPPTATFGVTINPGSLHQDYPLSSFHIDSGFTISSAFVLDPTLTNTIAPGDALFATIGGPISSFHITDGAGTILSGTFTSATFTSAESATAGSLSASNINGLVLAPGPAFTFDMSFVSSILASPTGFSISLSSIPGASGVSALATGPQVGVFIPVSIATFGLSSGSAVVSGTINVVPEPGTLALLSFGALALATPAYRRWRRKTPRASG
jgi:hypothetical protein